MKLSIILVATIVLVAPSVFSTVTEPKENNDEIQTKQEFQPELEIEEISGGFGVTAVVTNTGTEEANEVTWKIDLDGEYIFTGGFTLPPYPVIASIPAGESIVIESWQDRYIFGFGETNIDVTVESAEGAVAEKSVEGRAFGFFIGVNK